ncbi:MAG: glycosyltransferase family 4 protein [Promethearchaeota archaeon]
MKILFVSPSPPEYLGGLAHFTRDLAINLGKNNIKVDFLCSTLSKEGPIFQKLAKNVRLIKKKCYLLEDNNNFLRIKNPIFNTLSFLLKYGKNYDLIHVHSYIYFSTMQTVLYKKIFGKKIPLILHLHGGIQTSNFESTSIIEKIMLIFKKYSFDLTIGKIMMYAADAIISVSKDDLFALNKVFRINRKKHNYYIPNALDTNNFKKINGIEREYIGFIGRLTKIKGIDLFLKLIEKYNQIDKNQKFLIIGEGPYLSFVKNALKQYPIIFHERVPHEEMPKYYNKCSIFVQTSRAEGLPTCVIEALACEVPVVASNVGGIAELIKNGKTGYTFESGDIDMAIKHILKIEKENAFDAIGKNGRVLIESKYSWNQIVKKIILIYNRLISKK